MTAVRDLRPPILPLGRRGIGLAIGGRVLLAERTRDIPAGRRRVVPGAGAGRRLFLRRCPGRIAPPRHAGSGPKDRSGRCGAAQVVGHGRAPEARFVAEGFGAPRFQMMANDVVRVGAADDGAGADRLARGGGADLSVVP
jgi:hypothetical protein